MRRTTSIRKSSSPSQKRGRFEEGEAVVQSADQSSRGRGRRSPCAPRSSTGCRRGPDSNQKTARASLDEAALRQQQEKPKLPRPLSASSLEQLCSESAADDNGKDSAVSAGLAHLLAAVQALAAQSQGIWWTVAPSAAQMRAYMERLLAPRANAHLVRYIGCLADAGPGGEDAWARLLYDAGARRALIVGVVCRALTEKVFGELWFGASAEERRALAGLEAAQAGRDGFYRTAQRAAAISKFTTPEHDVDLERASTTVTLQLEALVIPLWKAVGQPTAQARLAIREQLKDIVDQAAVLSRAMRRAGDVVFYWVPVFKNEEFDPERMDCMNTSEMILLSPFEKRKAIARTRVVLQKGQEARRSALVKIACLQTLQACRQGGGALAQREMAQEQQSQGAAASPGERRAGTPLSGGDGYRSKTICKGLVVLQWGRQRLLTREAGTSPYVQAIRAGQTALKYSKDGAGCVEFYDMAARRWASSSE